MQNNQNKLSIVDQDSTLRIYNLDLRHKVRGLWDENIPLINHTVIEARGLPDEFLNSSKLLKDACDAFCRDTGLSVVERRIHQFEPIGKTVFMSWKRVICQCTRGQKMDIYIWIW